MFGIKILTTRKYNDMLADLKRFDEHIIELGNDKTKLENDIDSLRDQLNAAKADYRHLNKECENLQKAIVEMKQKHCVEIEEAIKQINEHQISTLKDYVVLHECNYKCEKCTLESPDCKKLVFADRAICIVHKDNINSFKKPAKNKKEKKQ